MKIKVTVSNHITFQNLDILLKRALSLCLFFVVSWHGYAQSNLSVSIMTPGTARGISYPKSYAVTVRILNSGPNAASNIPVAFRDNGGVAVQETYNGSIASGSYYDYTFTGQLNINSSGVHDIQAYTALAGDPNQANDTDEVRIITIFDQFPYQESFENNNGGLHVYGPNARFKWVRPQKTHTTAASDGLRAWTDGVYSGGTDIITGGYVANTCGAALEFPAFDFSNLQSPYVSFDIQINTEYLSGNPWEAITFQYSLDSLNWTTLGTNNEPVTCYNKNWFNVVTSQCIGSTAAWSGSPDFQCTNPKPAWCGTWANASHCMTELAGESRVYFRFIYVRSGTNSTTSEGLALDNVYIGEVPAAAIDFDATPVCVNEPMVFTNLSDSCANNFSWTFGDGKSGVVIKDPIRIYKQGGTFDVTLSASYGCNNRDSVVKQVTVYPAPSVAVNNMAKKFCINDNTPVNLTTNATPAGGQFYLIDNQDNLVSLNNPNSFVPSGQGLGEHKIVYSAVGGPNNCTGYDTVTFEVYQPDVDFNDLGGSYCLSTPVFNLSATPPGGTFMVNGSPSTTFDPNALGIGQHTVTYNFTDTGGCNIISTQIVDVVNAISVNIAGLSSEYCEYDNPITLTATPSGGDFEVDGIVTSTFDPAILGIGMHKVKYTYYVNGSCGAEDSLQVNIVPVSASLQGIDSVFCKNDAPYVLAGTPAGGIFKLDGIVVTQIDPSAIPQGMHNLEYIYTNSTGCSDTAYKAISVDDPQTQILSLFDNDSICISSAVIPLNAAPAGGIFSIDGQTATDFDPQQEGTGPHTVKYVYTNPLTMCSDSTTINIIVTAEPTVNIINLDTAFCITDAPFTLTASPAGGAFSVDGVPTQIFDPSQYQLNQTITVSYQYLDSRGCNVTVTQDVIVYEVPSVAIDGLQSTYCQGDVIDTLVGQPAGGQFTIDGNPAIVVDPMALSTGTHTVEYVFTNPAGCSNQISQVINIVDDPQGEITNGDVVEICAGESVTLNYTSQQNAVFTWNTGQEDNDLLVTPSQNTTYWINAKGCFQYGDTVDVIVHPLPTADFSLEDSAFILPFTLIAQNFSSGFSNSAWHVNGQMVSNDNNLNFDIGSEGNYSVKLVVSNQYGCTDSTTKIISASALAEVRLPNVFTPNSDGVNDDFGITNDQSAYLSDFEFTIFNRWGNVVFTTNNAAKRWDGMISGNKAAAGTYYYMLKARNPENKLVDLVGTVTIIH